MKLDKSLFVGIRIGYVRRREGISQAALAKDLGLSRDQLSSIESGRVSIKFHHAWKICRLLLIHPDWLYEGGDDSRVFRLPSDEIEGLDRIFLANKKTPFVDAWPDWGQLLYQVESEVENNELTDAATGDKNKRVKGEWLKLKKRINAATADSGSKTKLANYVGVDLTQLSKWLTDSGSAREPGAGYALLMLEWVARKERQKQKALAVQ